MKKNYIFIGLTALSVGMFAFQTDTIQHVRKFNISNEHLQSGGGQPSFTGAPGEQNCTQCHVGSTLDGTNENQLQLLNAQFQPVTSYNAGETYTVSLALVSDPAKKGFSSTVLDGTNSMAGSLAGKTLGGTQNFQNGGGTRDYVSHNSTSNTNSTTVWLWDWTAPATNVGNVTFYVAANVADGNGTATNDQIYLSQHVFGSVSGVEEKEAMAMDFSAGYNAEENKVTMEFASLSSDVMFFNLVDLNGKSVYTKQLSKSLVGKNKQTVALPAEIKNGIYVATLFLGNKPMSANVMVQK